MSSAVQTAYGSSFRNPLVRSDFTECHGATLDQTRFSEKLNQPRRLAICLAVGELAEKLRSANFSTFLQNELDEIWFVFQREEISFGELRDDHPELDGVATEIFVDNQRFRAVIRLRAGRENRHGFDRALLHQLRHVFDFAGVFQQRWEVREDEFERRALLLVSRFDEEEFSAGRAVSNSSFWRNNWLRFSPSERERLRTDAVTKQITRQMFFRDLIYQPMIVPVFEWPDESEYQRPYLRRRTR